MTPRVAGLRTPLRRWVLGGGFAVTALVAPVLVAFATPVAPVTSNVAACTPGEESDVFTTTCTPFLVPNSTDPFTTNAANPDIPEIDGIPCTGRDSGACIGLAENAEAQGPQPIPESTFSSSP